MPVSKEFIRAWHAWQRMPESIVNLSSYSDDSRIVCLADALNHMTGYLYLLGLDAIAGKSGEYAQRASEELAALEKISTELETCEASIDDKKDFRLHISAVRSLLEEMTKLPSLNRK